MQIVRYKCPCCGAQLDIDAALNKAFCQYCGTELLIKREQHEMNDPEEAGYQFEMGRIRAQQEAEQEARQRAWQANASKASSQFYEPFANFKAGEKDRLVALIICFFFGVVGGHYYYVGRIGKGILYLCTFGLFGFGWMIDIILILAGRFKDRNGNYLV